MDTMLEKCATSWIQLLTYGNSDGPTDSHLALDILTLGGRIDHNFHGDVLFRLSPLIGLLGLRQGLLGLIRAPARCFKKMGPPRVFQIAWAWDTKRVDAGNWELLHVSRSNQSGLAGSFGGIMFGGCSQVGWLA